MILNKISRIRRLCFVNRDSRTESKVKFENNQFEKGPGSLGNEGKLELSFTEFHLLLFYVLKVFADINFINL